VLFWRSRLFGDMALQFVYVALNALGWSRWLRGESRGEPLRVQRTPIRSAIAFAALVAGATPALMLYLRSVQGSAPFLDALTTMLSLVAQYMMTRKYLENWLVWILADVLYIGLYISRELRLTAVLYFVFLLMCIQGWREWRASAAIPAPVH
jgi:nicotinamide mononucleotide transporter